MAVSAPYLPYDKLRTIATEFLTNYHPSGDIPIPIERIIELRIGLDIVPVPGLQDEFDVDAYITGDLTEIRVDRFIQESRLVRYRFSLAHELAHYIIHQEVFQQLKFSTVAEWKAVISKIPSDQYTWIEWQAYCLGGLILVPGEPLQALFEEKAKEAKRAGVDLQYGDAPTRRIVESNLGRHFEVSADVIARRMKYDKLWS